jgi:hypothetical protein
MVDRETAPRLALEYVLVAAFWMLVVAPFAAAPLALSINRHR